MADGRVRALVGESALFAGQSWGKAPRAFDGPVVSLTVNDGEKLATLVCSENASFESGPRKALKSYLMALLDRLEGR